MIALSGIPLHDMVTVQMQAFYKGIVRRTAYKDMPSSVGTFIISALLSNLSRFLELRFLFVGT